MQLLTNKMDQRRKSLRQNRSIVLCYDQLTDTSIQQNQFNLFHDDVFSVLHTPNVKYVFSGSQWLLNTNHNGNLLAQHYLHYNPLAVT
jgi:hypothetical protein